MYNLADWSKAPDWAQYHTVDSDGRCFWHKTRPGQFVRVWVRDLVIGSMTAPCGKIDDMTGIDWTQTLEARPKESYV